MLDSWCTLESMDEVTISLYFIFILFFLTLIFPSLDRWVRRMERKRIWPFLKATKVVAGLGIACITCGCVVISGNRCACALGTSGIATNSNRIWNITSRDIAYLGTPDKCWAASKCIWTKSLRSWRKHIQEHQPYGRLPAHQPSSAGQSPRKLGGGAQRDPSLIELGPFEEVTQAARSKPHLCWWCCRHGLTRLFIPAKLSTIRQGLTTAREAPGKIWVVYCKWQLVSLSLTRVGDAAKLFFSSNGEAAAPQLEEDSGDFWRRWTSLFNEANVS